jgi:hypothetical protein
VAKIQVLLGENAEAKVNYRRALEVFGELVA